MCVSLYVSRTVRALKLLFIPYSCSFTHITHTHAHTHTHREDTKEAVGNSWDILNTTFGQNIIKIDQTRSYLANGGKISTKASLRL